MFSSRKENTLMKSNGDYKMGASVGNQYSVGNRVNN